MENMNDNIYESPEIQLIDIKVESIMCLSGDIEGITEEEWED